MMGVIILTHIFRWKIAEKTKSKWWYSRPYILYGIWVQGPLIQIKCSTDALSVKFRCKPIWFWGSLITRDPCSERGAISGPLYFFGTPIYSKIGFQQDPSFIYATPIPKLKWPGTLVPKLSHFVSQQWTNVKQWWAMPFLGSLFIASVVVLPISEIQKQ